MTRFFSKEGKKIYFEHTSASDPLQASTVHSSSAIKNCHTNVSKPKHPLSIITERLFTFQWAAAATCLFFFFQTSIMDLVSTMIPLALCCVWIDTGMRATSGRLQLKLDPEKFVNARIRTSISRSDDLLVLCDKEMTALVSCCNNGSQS